MLKLGGKKLSHLNYSAIAKQSILNKQSNDKYFFYFLTNTAVLMKESVLAYVHYLHDDIQETFLKMEILKFKLQMRSENGIAGMAQIPKAPGQHGYLKAALVGILWVSAKKKRVK